MQFALAENKTNKHNDILAFCELSIKRLLVLLFVFKFKKI